MPTSADYTVQLEAAMTAAPAGNIVGVAARMQTDGSGYVAYFVDNGDAVISRRTTNGAYAATLATGTIASYSNTSIYTIFLTVSGDTVSAIYKDSGGTTQATLSGTDGNITTAGSAGMFLFDSTTLIHSICAR